MTEKEHQIQDLIRIDPEVWFSTFAVIKDKRGKDIKPKANTLQKRMFAHYRKCQLEQKPCKMIILKPRQKGASTCAQALTYHHMRKHENLAGSLMGGYSGNLGQGFRDLPEIRGKRRVPLERYRNKPRGRWKSRRRDQASQQKRLRQRDRRIQKCRSKRNYPGR